MKINEFFDKIYCINLDERSDRWVESLNEFKKIGLTNVERVSAVKHEKGTIGCRESHLTIIKKAKSENLKNILIFEDDLLFIKNDLNLIENTLTNLSSIKWDLFYLGATVDPNVGKLTKVCENLVKTNFAYTTHAYGVNHNIFDYILEEAPYHGVIDVFYNNKIIPRGNSFIINPMVCIQRESYSDIEKTKSDYNWMLEFFNKGIENGR